MINFKKDIMFSVAYSRTTKSTENFAKFIGNRDDVWYATNIEIYNYVMAYNSLQTSADLKMIYNPSAIDVWAMDKDGVFCIESGKTVFR